MTSRQFAWHLRTRGPALSAWPKHERAAAFTLLSRDPAAQQALAEALEAEQAEAPDCLGLGRMQAAVRRALAPIPGAVRWAAIAACAAAGLCLGIAGQPRTPSGPVPTMQATLSSTVLAAAEP